MQRPVIGFHVIGCTYGFWLPNDQRGSGSDFVRSDDLTKFGPANPVTHRRSVARKSYDFQVRQLARESLTYPPVVLNDAQMDSVTRGFEKEVTEFSAAPMHALAILPEHFHFVCGRCRYDIRRFEGRLKGAATKEMIAEGLHPLLRYPQTGGTIPSPWSQKPWIVYLFTDVDMRRAIKYVEDNPLKVRRPRQHHQFLTAYE
jgi:hypothetical protein